MKAYRISWLIVCGALGAVGASVAFAWSIPAMLATFVCAALAGAGAALARPEFTPGLDRATSPAETRRLTSTYAFVGGSATVAAVGLGGLLGARVAVLVVVMAAGSSPSAIRLYRRWLRRPALQPYRERVIGSGTNSPSRSRTRPRPRTQTGSEAAAAPRVAPRSLTDDELCLAWRASFSALQRATSRSERLSIVDARSEYLDEFERRNRQGLTAWLASGARAAGDPSRFLIGGGASHSAIDWDGLIHGPDR
jgi:hypothetical protein